ncbi:MAG: disulfide bond formation protein DsbA [Burkholderiales bacterium PBB4]|nr:MAG: disulfide bond formation protein DsbA [Burkholderiales bacterium PBB4]
MKHLTFYLDFISPYAYLAFHALPTALLGQSYTVTYTPVFLGALLKHNAMLGPAEVPPKRDWIYRQVQWQAQQQGLALNLPAVHPFNPLGLLRLAVACQAQGQPNRYVCETLFRHVWQGGLDAADPVRLEHLTAQLAPARQGGDDSVKAQLKAHADQAIAAGVFGVPAIEVDGKVFWGLDSLPMLRSYLAGDPWFSDARWEAVSQVPSGIPLGRR